MAEDVAEESDSVDTVEDEPIEDESVFVDSFEDEPDLDELLEDEIESVLLERDDVAVEEASDVMVVKAE